MPKISKNQYTLREMYAYYKKNTVNPVDKATFKAVLITWGLELQDMLVEGKDVMLPNKASRLAIRKTNKRTYIDRVASKEQRKLVIKPNIHSDFFGARVYWGKRIAKLNFRGWRFKPVRELKKKIAVVMLQPGGHSRYVKRARSYSKETKDFAYNRGVNNFRTGKL